MGINSIKVFISFHHFCSLNLEFKYSVMYCYLINYPSTQLVKTNIHYLRVCVYQESGCSLAGCLSLTVSNKIAVKPLAEAAVI